MRYVNTNKIAHKARLSTLNIGASLILLLNSFAAASPLFLTGKAFANPSVPSVPVQTSPTNGASLTDGNVTLVWNASTNSSGTVFYTVAVATSSATNADGSFSSSTGGTTTTSLNYTPSGTLAAGTYYWNIEACNDNSGSHCSAWSTPESFTVAAADTTGPTIGTTTPTDDEVISKNGSYTVSAVVSDPSGVQSVSYSATGGGLCIGGFCLFPPETFGGTLTDPDHDGTYTATLDTATYGQTPFIFSTSYTFTFTATDNAAAHNSTTKTVSDVTFSTPPVSTASVTGQDFDTWDDSANGFKGINVGFETADFNQINSITVTLQKNGSDIVSNTASAALLDDINTQQDGFTQNGSLSTPFVVSGTLNDTYCQGGPCWNAGTHTWQTTEQPDTAIVTVTGTDASGSVTKTATLTNFTEPNGVTFADLFPADTTAPVVEITAPDNGDHVHGTVTISGTVTDTNPDHYYLVVKNSHGTVVAGPGTVYTATVSDYSWDTTKVADGVYTIDLEARDQAGNKDASSVQTITVTVDNTAPVVTVDTLSTTDTTPPVTGTVDDSGATVTILVNGHKYGATVGTTVNGSGTYNWTADVTHALAVGNYDVSATAIDEAGNTGNDSTTNELAITAPPVTLTNFTPATTPPQTGQGTGNGNAQDQTQDQSQGQVLSDNAGAPAPEDQGHVKGDQTSSTAGSPQKETVAESGSFLGLGWWWLLIVAIVGGLWFVFFRRRDQEA